MQTVLLKSSSFHLFDMSRAKSSDIKTSAWADHRRLGYMYVRIEHMSMVVLTYREKGDAFCVLIDPEQSGNEFMYNILSFVCIWSSGMSI